MTGLETKKNLKKPMKFILAFFICFTFFFSRLSYAMVLDDPNPEASDFAKAQVGDWAAQSKLGYYYLNEHHGVKADGAEAEKWYVKAAQQDIKGLQYKLGLRYFEGTPAFPRNDEKSFYWLYAFRTSATPLA
ncbi:MAG: hypothetical protein PSY14_04605 [bacterium]|nr:hypothetical protein [bacterium]